MGRKIRVFTGLDRWPAEDEHWLVGFVRAALDPADDAEKLRKYGARAEAFEAVDSVSEADVCALPFVWDFYLRSNKIVEAKQLAEAAKSVGKEIIVWNGGDREAIIPISNAIQFNHGPNRSLRRSPRKVFAFPQFKPDWLETYCEGNLHLRSWQTVPVVGFCGWADWSWTRLLARIGANALYQCRHRLGFTRYVPSPIKSPLLLRKAVLDLLGGHTSVQTRFITRREYRGGLKGGNNDETFCAARLEFVNNLLNTDYTVCVRGVGNFSARFYEALCLGRIPIFVNTDCILPYQFTINWRDYCVWVEESELVNLPEILIEFHQRHSGAAFVELQKACRAIWVERLSSQGFYSHFREHLEASR